MSYRIPINEHLPSIPVLFIFENLYDKNSINEFFRDIPPQKRTCMFQDENDFIKLHKNYTQANCFMECRLNYAKRMLYEKDGKNYTCTPWFFPFVDDGYILCNPWDSGSILRRMLDDIPKGECKQCLPDCRRISYSYLVSAQSIRKCTEKNFMIGDFCSMTPLFDQPPQIWTDQVKLDRFKEMLASKTLLFQMFGLDYLIFSSSNLIWHLKLRWHL